MKIPANHSRRAWRKILGLCSWVALLSSSLWGGEFSVTMWDVDEGLPQSPITDIAQTPDGFLWVGTSICGLSRFDGVQFVNFALTNAPDLDVPSVRRMLVDSDGNLWVTTGAGSLFLLQGNAFVKAGEGLQLKTFVGKSQGRIVFATTDGELIFGHRGADGQWTWERRQPPGNFHSSFNYFEDSDEAFWFQTRIPGGTIGRFENDHFETLDSPPGLAGAKIQVLARDKAGQIWAGTDTGLVRWEHGTFTNLNPAGPVSKMSVRIITPTADGGLWVEASGKLFFYDHDHNQWSEPVPEWDGNQEPWSNAHTFRSDNVGGLWISLHNEGLVHVGRDGKLVRLTDADGLPKPLAQASFSDREGNFWAAYHGGGLIQVRPETFHSLTQRDGLRDTIVTSVMEDSAGSIWLGMGGGSVVLWTNGACQIFSLPLLGNACRDVVGAAGPDGRLWLGTSGDGLLVREHGEFRHVLLTKLISHDIRQLLVAKNGDVWFANLLGLYRFDGKNLERVLAPDSPGQLVASLTQGASGAIWFGTYGGSLRCWQDGKLSSYQPSDNFPSSRFWALCPEADGTIWVGTMNGGLLRFKDGRFTRFTTADGLADDSISHVLADDSGNLWFASRVGVMCVSEKSLVPREARKTPIACRLFGRSDGLPSLEMTLESQPSCLKARAGTLWFGSPKGASWVSPASVRPRETAPMVLLESVLADNNAQAFSQSGSRSALPEIIVPAGVRNLKVSFTAPNFTAPDLMRFQYRLDQLDTNWIDLGRQRSVAFNHLPAGEYTFRVTAENRDGLWSHQPAAFQLVVQPFFWQRKSFLVAALLVLLGALAFIIRRITQQRLLRRLETLRFEKQLENERVRIAQDLHDDLGAGLTEISLTSDMANNTALPEYDSRRYTREIGVRARELVQRLDEIVWAVNPHNDSVVSLSVYACQYAQQLLKPLDIACRLDVQPGLPEMPLTAEQRYHHFLAFKEAINNVARHSGATELHLAIHTEDGKLIFLIKDNGRGFEPGSELPGADGLRNIRERITRMGGKCEISSGPGRGTCIFMGVPLASGTKTP